MNETYREIQREYLKRAWARPATELERCIPASYDGRCYYFDAFGEPCELRREGILLSATEISGAEGVLIALYASWVPDVLVRLQPLKSFKEIPNSMPYQGAFTAHAEGILVPYVTSIRREQERILISFGGHNNSDAPSGDFSFTLYPLPKVPLYYIFHLPDDEFPAAVTCLFASNATDFLPVDGLADVAEVTAKRIIALVGGPGKGYAAGQH
ncbi:MAG: DUF3786 domain-containing protein [Thermodesulfobacteriota bacterium]